MPADTPNATDRRYLRTGRRRSNRFPYGARQLLLAACLSMLSASRTLAAQTLDIYTDADLRRAAMISAREDVNLLVYREVRVPKTVMFAGTETIVRIVGASPDAGFFLDIVWDGDWKRTPNPAMNGLHFKSRQVILHGLTFRGFEYNGAVIKGHGRELLQISNCTFQDNGTVYYPTRRAAKSADIKDAIVTQCVAAHGMKDGHLEVVNSRFINCSHNGHRWGRCIYSSARSLTLLNNRFDRCGGAFGVNAYVAESSATILNNQIKNPMPSYDQPRGLIRPPIVAPIPEGRNIAILFNSFRGELVHPFVGKPDPRFLWLDYNDYRGVQLIGPTWYKVWDVGNMKMDSWQAQGFDRHSLMPTKPFKRYQERVFIPDRPVRVSPGPDLEPQQR